MGHGDVAWIEFAFYILLLAGAAENVWFWTRMGTDQRDGFYLPLFLMAFTMFIGTLTLTLRAFVVALPYHDDTEALVHTDYILRPFHGVVLFATFTVLRLWRRGP